MIIKGKYADIKVFADIIDDSALVQLEELANQEFVKGSIIRIMPDAHAGKGCVIGTTMTITDKIVPNLVGVDIGCGMLCVDLGKSKIDYKSLDAYIYRNVPAGRDIFKNRLKFKTNINKIRCMNHLKNKDVFFRSVGTLGGGNHFIEIDKDDEGNHYLIIHSGSRNLGKQVADYYQNLAIKYHENLLFNKSEEINRVIMEFCNTDKKKEIKKRIKDIKNKKVDLNIPRDLCYLEGDDFDDYMHDIEIVQRYASENRMRIAETIVEFLGMELDNLDYFETIHNYIDHDDMILRKGAVASYKNERLLIPINMKDGCLICVGKSNEDYNYSAPHGAGRLLSRTKAKQEISLDDYIDSMEGIYSTSVNRRTIDESCFAYKPLESILNNIEGTVDVIKQIKPVYNFKSSR